ncbi:MAG TPA: TolC family protein [Terricaulis sp.]|nr:TolC family protein [Terricaulis sp.]
MSNSRLRGGLAHALRTLALTTSASLLCVGASGLAFAQSVAAQEAPLALDDALNRAITHDPGLRAAQAGVDAAHGGRLSARARPNPELGIEIENFNGPGELRGFNSAETTFSLSQELELGGQRSARIAVAEYELQGAALDRAIRGLDLIRDVQIAYFTALAAQEQAEIERERLRTAEALHASVARRVAAARDPLMAGARAQASLAEARIAVTRTEAQAANARAHLASYWGGDESFTLIIADFALPRAEAHTHEAPSEAHPDLARLAATRDAAGAQTRLERSLAFQNPTLSFGYRRFEDHNGDGALMAGISIPLGVNNRNRGAIARAEAEQRRARYDMEAARQTLTREFAATTRARDADARAVAALEDDVIPQAERALALAQDGYNRGAFSYLDVLDAQRALSDARATRVEALLSFHINEAALDRLTARFANAPIAETIP